MSPQTSAMISFFVDLGKEVEGEKNERVFKNGVNVLPMYTHIIMSLKKKALFGRVLLHFRKQGGCSVYFFYIFTWNFATVVQYFR